MLSDLDHISLTLCFVPRRSPDRVSLRFWRFLGSEGVAFVLPGHLCLFQPVSSESKLNPFHGFHQEQKAFVSVTVSSADNLGVPKKGHVEIPDLCYLPGFLLLPCLIPHRFPLEFQFFLSCAELLGSLQLLFLLFIFFEWPNPKR